METKPTLKDWILATRPWSFPVSSLPAIIGVIYSIYLQPDCISNLWLGIVAVVGAVIFHAGGNLISDYNDFKHGVDREGKIGTDTLTSGLFQPKQLLRYGISFLAVGITIGFFLLWRTSPGLLLVGTIGIISAVYYFLFKSKALGDLLIFLVYGPAIVMGAGYVMTGMYDWRLFIIACPIVFITVGVLHANNTRDTRSDAEAGIKTFAMLIGLKLSKLHYCLLMLLPYAALTAMVIVNLAPVWVLASLLTLPLAIKNCKTMNLVTDGDDMSAINDLDKHTAQLQLPFSLLLTIGLVVGILV